MISVITDHPIALDSDDHIHPDGIHLDNHVDANLISDIETYFQNRKIDILDLGCAGGEFITQMAERGHNAVGIDGSDHCLNIKADVIQKLGSLPLGRDNWLKYGNSKLFTCDITYPYEIQEDGNLKQFDLITSFDVMEHFYPDRIDTAIEMILKHLKLGGIFVAEVALFSVKKNKILEQGEIEYHKSLFTREEWLEMFDKHLTEIKYPFGHTVRQHNPELNPSLRYAGMKK